MLAVPKHASKKAASCTAHGQQPPLQRATGRSIHFLRAG
jgi:hypothetical protein